MKEINEIIKRLMYSQGYEKKKDLAEALNLSPSDFNNRTKSGTIRQLLINLAIQKGVNLDWLLTGDKSLKTNTGPQEGYIHDNASNIGELIKQTTNVLMSNTKYGRALKESIEAFHLAITERPEPSLKKPDDPPNAASSGSKKAATK